nr:DUF6531 domain-containing protein [Streptomyces sp. NBC_00899]
MGLGSFANKLGDGIEHGVDKVKKKAGEVIDHGAHIVGDGLEHVGLDDAADWVEDKGDHIADHLGAHVAEQQLGQTDEPGELLHGDPDKIRAAVLHLAKFALAFDAGHTGLSHLDPGDWDGFGADAFRTMFKAQPPKWAHAATACAEAGLALENYAETVDWAKGQAKEAVRLWKQGVAARKAAADAYNTAVDQYHDDVKAYNDKVDDGKDPGTKPAKPADFTDPGAKDKQAAKDTLNAARKQRDSAAATAEAKVRKATELAPKKPDFTDRMQNDFGDVGKALPIAGEHFAGGLVRSLTDLNKFARGLNPMDPYNLTHPAQYLTHLNATAAGLVDMTQHPERLPGIILGTGWGSDGSEASGRLVGNILLAIATDGGSAAGKTVAEDAAKKAAKDAAEQAARGGARAAAEDPAKAAIEQAAKKCLSDPIDVATGDMILPQTDITLPGTLPLVLERTHLSSYRVGRFFGPSWASTLDQRLELDDQGVAFVADDGSILLYPAPEPGTPALPSHGPRWPLEWDGRPGSPLRITKTEAGHTLHFATVPGTAATSSGPMLLPLTEVTDRNGNTYAITYNDVGVPEEIRHSGGYHLTLSSDNGRVTALRLLDPAAPGSATLVRSYGYDDAENVTDVADSTGVPYRFSYDTARRITSWTDRNETSYHYTYDHRGRCTATHGTDGFLSSTFAYDDATRTTTFTNSLGHSSTYTHNTAHRLIAETDPLGHTTTHQWDPANLHVTEVTDPLGHTTRYAYDEDGHLTAAVRPDGTQMQVEYNDLGRPLRIVEPSGAVWTHTYDGNGNALTVTDPLGATTSYANDEAGKLTAVTNPFGHTRTVASDAAGLPVRITDELGHATTVSRDAFGRPVELTDPLGQAIRMAWTPEGKPAWREDADGARETWAWDGEGNLTAHIDQAGHTTRYTYTHFELVATRADPDGRIHSFAYDTELRLTAVTNPQGLTWTYSYDPAGRLAAETDFDGRTLAYAYDAAGRLAARTDPLGRTTSFERDALGQVVRKRAGDRVTTFAYDPAGRLTAAANPDAEIAYVRDRLGQVTSEATAGRVLTHAYDAVGRPVHRTTPSGAVTTYAYNAAGHRILLTAGDHSLDFTHDAIGRETARRIDNALTLSQSWDVAGRLREQHLTAASTGVVQGRAYTYRSDGHLTGVHDHAAGSRTFDLDMVGRVTAVHAERWSETYSYDEAGNQTSAAWPAEHPDTEATGPRAYAGTRITRAGTTRYEHDAAGRVTLRQKTRLSRKPDTWHYTWDSEDHLTSVVTPDGTIWRYLYDPLGRRTAKCRMADDGENVLERVDFTWDGSTLIEQTTTISNGSRPITLTWDHDGLRPLVQTERVTDTTSQRGIDQRFFAIVTDLVGTPTELVNTSGTLTWRACATSWGNTTWPPTATSYTPLRFPGQYHDPETGLHYNLHRHYDPTTGRYTTPDPLGLVPSPNPATYVHNPHTWTDPLGLSPYPTTPPAKVTELPEVVAPKPLKPQHVEQAWKDFLGDGPYTNIHPRKGIPDPDRLVSADGKRSIRMGPHEMNSKLTKFHFHMETWDFIAPTNEWVVGNTMVRVPLGLK